MSNDNAQQQAMAQVGSINEMVAALLCNYDRLSELREERDDFVIGAPDGTEVNDPAAWAQQNPADYDELTALESAAGNCTDADEALQVIHEDPLEIQVRSDWANVGHAFSANEFMILLCTGGPAVRIMGELDDCQQPCRAWIEYQDWGTGWTELVAKIDNDTLLTYCQQHYFGE